MEGEGGSKGNKKGVRRPMNAFLIFCKRHRSRVREKNPQMDNRSITRVLGDIWAKMDKEEKASFTLLAKQYKDAFMKANPGYKWHSSDKVHSGATGNSSSNNNTGTVSSNKHQHFQNIRVSTEITPGKLADPCQMGGLNLLLKAGKESEQLQTKWKPSVPASSSPSLFSFTPISIPPPTQTGLGQGSRTSTSSSVSVPHPRNVSSLTDPQSLGCLSALSSSSSSSTTLTDGVPSHSALLQLAEMCTTELYSGTEEVSASQLRPKSLVSISPPKKRAQQQWHGQSLSPLADDNGRKHWQSSNPFNRSGKDVVTDADDKGSHCVAGGNDEFPLDLSQAHANSVQQPAKKTRSRRVARGARKEPLHTWSRRRKRSSSATDSVSPSSSPSVSPVNHHSNVVSQMSGVSHDKLKSGTSRSGVILASLPQNQKSVSDSLYSNAGDGLCPQLPQDEHVMLSYPCVPSEGSKIASLLKATPGQSMSPPSDSLQNVPVPPLTSLSSCKDHPKARQVDSKPNFSLAATATNSTPSPVVSSHSQPFTQGKVKKKWTQRMMVEAKQEEELALAQKESQQQQLSTGQAVLPSLGGSGHTETPQLTTTLQCSNHDTEKAKNTKIDCAPFRHVWGEINASKYPLTPPPPINTSFPLPVSGEAHKSHTLYKALTSQMSPPRHRPPATTWGPHQPPTTQIHSSSSSPPASHQDKQNSHSNNIFDPITACGKKFTDHIVEQLVLHSSSNDKKEKIVMPTPPLISTTLFPPSASPSMQPLQLTDASSDHLCCNNKLLPYGKTLSTSGDCKGGGDGKVGSGGIWANVATHFGNEPLDMKNKDWKTLGVEKKEFDSSSFPASSLFEKVARKVSKPKGADDSPTVNGVSWDGQTGMLDCGDGGPGKLSPSQHVPTTVSLSPTRHSNLPCSELFSGVSTALGISASVTRHQLSCLAEGNGLPHPCNQGGTSPPVRKSRRANRGQKYQALIKEGIIQPSKERMAVRAAPRAARSTGSYKEESGDPQQAPELVRAHSCRERATPSPRTVKSRASPVELFDFDKATASVTLTLPSQPPQDLQLHRQKRRKKRPDRKVTAHSASCGGDATDPIPPSPDLFVQVHRHGTLSYHRKDPHLGATLKLKDKMRGWCSTRVPLTDEERTRIYTKETGSARRRMRCLRILHIVHESYDWIEEDDRLPLPSHKALSNKGNPRPELGQDKCGIVSYSSQSLPDLPQSSTVAITTPDSIDCVQTHHTVPDSSSTPRKTPVSGYFVSDLDIASPAPGLGLTSPHIPDRKQEVKGQTPKKLTGDGMSPIHLLTTAAMQSERALYPALPKASSADSPPINASNLVSPRPASVPFVEDSGLFGQYDQSFTSVNKSSTRLLSSSMSSLGPHSPQWKSATQLTPHSPQGKSATQLMPHSPQWKSATHLDGHSVSVDQPPIMTLSSLPAMARTPLTSVAESPSKQLASSALLSLSRSASAVDLPNHSKPKDQPRQYRHQKPFSSLLSSSPHIVSTLFAPPPLSSVTAASRKKPATTCSIPTLLNIPTIGSSPGTSAYNQKSQELSNHNGQGMLNVPDHRNRYQPPSDQPDHRNRYQPPSDQGTPPSHKQSVMQHSQKLVRLLTTANEDVVPFTNSQQTRLECTQATSDLDSINPSRPNKTQSESLPMIPCRKAAVPGSIVEGLVAKHPHSQSGKRRATSSNSGSKVEKQRKRQKTSGHKLSQQQHHHQAVASHHQQQHHHQAVASHHQQQHHHQAITSHHQQQHHHQAITSHHQQQHHHQAVASHHQQQHHHQAISKHQTPGQVVRGLTGSKLFPSLPPIGHNTTTVMSPSSLPAGAAVTSLSSVTAGDAASKKHKPTIWDHLSSQCPMPLKSAKMNRQQTSPLAMGSTGTTILPLRQPPKQTNATATVVSHPQILPSAYGNDSLTRHTPSPWQHGQDTKPQTCSHDGRGRIDDEVNGGSDTDSAEEEDNDDEKVLCIVEGEDGPSDTDSAQESEFDTDQILVSTNGTPSMGTCVTPSMGTGVTPCLDLKGPSLDQRPPVFVTATDTKDCHSARTVSVSSNVATKHTRQASDSLAQGQSSPQPPHYHGNQSLVTTQQAVVEDSRSSIAVPPSPLPPAMVTSHPLPMASDTCIVVAQDSTLPSNFVSVSSITLPSDLPEPDQHLLPVPSTSSPPSVSRLAGHSSPPLSLRNVLLADPDPDTTSSLSGQVVVKTISPTSPFPSPHVTDLSSTTTTTSPALLPPPPSSPPTSYSSMAPLPPHITPTTSTSYGNILLSTLQSPHFIFIPQQQHHQNVPSTSPPSSSSPAATPSSRTSPSLATSPTTDAAPSATTRRN